MYVKTICPVCKGTAYHSIALHCFETSQFTDFDSASRYAIEHIEVKESVKEADFVQSIMRTISRHLYDGIEVNEIYAILKRYYGIAAAYCGDIISQIKIEFDMYCPDRKHLFFVCL